MKSCRRVLEYRLIEFPGAMSVGIDLGRFLRRYADTRMFQPLFASGRPQADFPQRIQISQLVKQHGYELFPTVEPLGVEPGLMLLDEPCELSAWKKLEKLRADAAKLSHG